MRDSINKKPDRNHHSFHSSTYRSSLQYRTISFFPTYVKTIQYITSRVVIKIFNKASLLSVRNISSKTVYNTDTSTILVITKYVANTFKWIETINNYNTIFRYNIDCSDNEGKTLLF